LFQVKTVIAITQRLCAVIHWDQILVLKQGKVVEQRNQQILLAMNGVHTLETDLIDA
jgi:ABC-type multidrug transport system fused ATPase/permease subunit